MKISARTSGRIYPERRAGLWNNRVVLVTIGGRRFTIPAECPCCGATPDTELAIPLTRVPGRAVAADSAHELIFPYCRHCTGHTAAWEHAGVVPAGVMLGGIIAAIGLGLAVHPLAGAAAFGVALPAAWFLRQSQRATAKQRQRPSCAGPGRALAYLGWSGSESAFELESHAYAARFAEHNQAVLSSPSPQLTRLLDANRVARLAVPTPAQAVLTVPPPATAAEWVTRIEAAPGAVARRTTLTRALDALHEAADREAVIGAAAGLELAPLIDELGGLGPSAARAVLVRAIAGVSADNIPEELQRAVLRELDRRAQAL
jgi:hypothetical protein